MKLTTRLMLLAGALTLTAASAWATLPEDTPAFPGAEGYGRYVTGGRGGYVYHVTNLLDNTSKGSFRWALSQTGPRTIVFDVSGTIHLTSSLKIPSNTTVAGQTAPGDGICIADYPCSLGGNNIIVRYMRFRLGNTNVTIDGADGWDGFGGMDLSDIIVDHCSVSWSIDECLSLLGNVNTTLQWSIISQSLVDAGHSKGNHGYGGNWGGTYASFHHNLMIHHTSRTPRLGPRPTTQLNEQMDMRNNVIYNFGGNGCYGGEGMNVNIVNNYYKPGPGSPTGTKGRRIAGIGVRTNSYVATYPAYAPALHLWGTYYVDGNVNPTYGDVTRDNWTYGIYNQIDTSDTDGTWNDQVKADIKLAEPIWYVTTTTHSAEDAYERVLDYAGASLSRDSHDALMVSDARSGVATYTGSGLSKGFINSQDDNKPSGAGSDWSAWPTLNSTEAPLDSDGDGMPDAWELANGLDPYNAADRNNTDSEGYTMLELYINSLVDHITEAQNAGGTPMGDIILPDDVLDTYLLDMTTKSDSGWSFGHGISITNDNSGSYVSKGDYFGFGRDITHTITLPSWALVTAVEVEGFSRYSSDTYTEASLIELGGETFEQGTYTLPKGTADDAGTFTVTLANPVADRLTMTWTGNNPYVRIILHCVENPNHDKSSTVTPEAGITTITAFHEADAAWYTTTGLRLSAAPTQPGFYIHGRNKVIVK